VEYYQCLKDMLDEVLKLNEQLLETNKNWREHAKFFNELSKVIDLIPLTLICDIFDSLTPQLIDLMKRAPDVLKAESSLLLATLIFYVPSQARRKKLIDQVIAEFSNTRSSILRKSFIQFCVAALQVCSILFVKTYLLKDIMTLAQDVVPSVRINFLLKLVPELNKYIGGIEQSFVVDLIQIVDRNK
jgi:hypothetical protein